MTAYLLMPRVGYAGRDDHADSVAFSIFSSQRRSRSAWSSSRACSSLAGCHLAPTASSCINQCFRCRRNINRLGLGEAATFGIGPEFFLAKNLSGRTRPARKFQKNVGMVCMHIVVGWGGGPSEFIAKGTGWGSFLEAHLNRRWLALCCA